MLKLENIDKLIGTSILNWECVNISDALGTYLITFKPRGNSIFTVEFLLNRDDSHLRGIYKVDGMLYESSGFSNVLIGNFDMHVTRTELQTPMEFIRVLTQPLRVFEKDMEVNIQRKMFNTSSLASNKFVSNGMFGSPFGKTIPKPPPITSNGTPTWYVSESESEIKKPTMWETFKEMVNWNKWIGILFPIKQSYDTVKELYEEKKPKKLRAKKAAF